MVRIQAEIDGAGSIASVQNPPPGLSAIRGSEHASLFIRTVGVPERRDVDQIGISRMNANPRYRLCVGEAGFAPGFAGVDRFVDAVALQNAAPQLRLPPAEVDDVGIRVCYGYRADRSEEHTSELQSRLH